MKPDKNWVVYLVLCYDKSLYCGITNNLKKLLEDPNPGKGAKYTRSRAPVELLGTSSEMTKSEALKSGHRVRKKPTSRKLTELENGKEQPEMENEQILQEIQKEIQSIVKTYFPRIENAIIFEFILTAKPTSKIRALQYLVDSI